MHKVLIGLNSFNDLHLLREVMPGLEEIRRNLPADAAVLDTAHNDEVRAFFAKEYSEWNYMRHGRKRSEGNIGYGRSFNEILKAHPGHKYLLVCTSDVILDGGVVAEFVARMEADRGLAMCAGKMHYWDIAAYRKTQQIDTLGIMVERRHHFYDRGCGEEDRGQYDERLDEAFGISGAAFLLRTAVIAELNGGARRGRDVKGADWQLFDERIWMYKEDVDLSYRLRWLGAGMKIFPEVWGWHARTVANKAGQGMGELMRADKGKRDYARAQSYKNHFRLLKNNFTWRYGPGVLARVVWYELLKGAYMLVRHPLVFFAGMRNLLFAPRKRIVRRASAKEVLSYFQ